MTFDLLPTGLATLARLLRDPLLALGAIGAGLWVAGALQAV